VAATVVVDGWAAGYRDVDDARRRLVEAALACIARWGVRKTSLDDIAREAGVGRATVYRAFPGGKERLVEAVLCHEAGRFFDAAGTALRAAPTLGDMVTAGLSAAFDLLTGHAVLRSVLHHEPELVLPHFAFDRLDRFLDLTAALCQPHLARFLPPAALRPASDLLARVALTFGLRPPAWFDPRDPGAVRRLVETYVLPAITPTPREEPPCPATTS
jgi:AcrR family transcriptional regulator